MMIQQVNSQQNGTGFGAALRVKNVFHNETFISNTIYRAQREGKGISSVTEGNDYYLIGDKSDELKSIANKLLDFFTPKQMTLSEESFNAHSFGLTKKLHDSEFKPVFETVV